jgi:hypothetical protein
VQELLERGAKFDDANNEGKTPLSIAIEKGHLEVDQELQAAMNTAKKT